MSPEGAAAGWPGAVLDLRRIAEKLGRLSVTAGGIQDEPIHSDVTRRLWEGYREIDGYLAEGTDLFALGNSRRILELNHIVLCGRSPGTRKQTAAHMQQTAAHFDDLALGDIGGKIDWYDRHRDMPTRERAAGFFVEIVSAPQLFIEGNERTAVLLMSFILARDGLPPFVLSAETARETFALTSSIKALDSRTLWFRLRAPSKRRALAALLAADADPALLLGGA